jgi:hypothetical protein
LSLERLDGLAEAFEVDVAGRDPQRHAILVGALGTFCAAAQRRAWNKVSARFNSAADSGSSSLQALSSVSAASACSDSGASGNSK